MSKVKNAWLHFQDFGAKKPNSISTLVAVTLPGRASDYLARDKDGAPVILISCQIYNRVKAPFRLKNVSIEFDQNYRIEDETGTSKEGQFISITCSAANPSLFEFFVRSSEALVNSIPTNANLGQIDICIAGFVELYKAQPEVDKKILKGLWAELLTICSSSNPEQLLQGWRLGINDVIDFSLRLHRIEVKSTESKQRVHEFSLDQVAKNISKDVFVYSYLLEQVSIGLGIIDLATSIETRVMDFSLRIKLWKNIRAIVGDNFFELDDYKYDEKRALASLKIFSINDLPKPINSDPVKILEVRFKVNLDGINSSAINVRDKIEEVLN